jgi:PAS domain-containing protein
MLVRAHVRSNNRVVARLHDRCQPTQSLFAFANAWRLDGPIEFWNAGAERLYGFASNEVVGHSSHTLFGVSPNSAPAAFDFVMRLGSSIAINRSTTIQGIDFSRSSDPKTAAPISPVAPVRCLRLPLRYVQVAGEGQRITAKELRNAMKAERSMACCSNTFRSSWCRRRTPPSQTRAPTSINAWRGGF